jgi:hypothetical protein
MKLITADHGRRLQIPGVPAPVLRPVDIDKSKTGFHSLRSLRIYRFDAGSVIDGHAEEDEVMIVLLAGSIGLTLIDGQAGGGRETFTLSAVTDQLGAPCAAYLPPNAAYRLVATTGADVAYARATPVDGPPPRVFHAAHAAQGPLLWEELKYPRLLRVRVLLVVAGPEEATVTPLTGSESGLEALLHVRTAGGVGFTGETSGSLASWDTLAVTPGKSPVLHIPKDTTALILVVLAMPA